MCHVCVSAAGQVCTPCFLLPLCIQCCFVAISEVETCSAMSSTILSSKWLAKQCGSERGCPVHGFRACGGVMVHTLSLRPHPLVHCIRLSINVQAAMVFVPHGFSSQRSCRGVFW
jgi:hypothetical protein